MDKITVTGKDITEVFEEAAKILGVECYQLGYKFIKEKISSMTYELWVTDQSPIPIKISKLVSCPDCGNKISRKAPACPSCGCPNECEDLYECPSCKAHKKIKTMIVPGEKCSVCHMKHPVIEEATNANPTPPPTPSYVTCPYCKSTDTKKISGLKKVGSVAVWGVLAAGAVAKQWHCNKCKSEF